MHKDKRDGSDRDDQPESQAAPQADGFPDAKEEATEILSAGADGRAPVADAAERGSTVPSSGATEILTEGEGAQHEEQRGSQTPTTTDVSAPAGTMLRKGLPGKFGRYEVLEEIAHGGMGIVYKARDPELNRIIALKVMIAGEAASAELIQRFHVEAQAAARLRHPHIVSIHEVGVAEGLHYFTMDFVDGESLLKAIRDEKLSLQQSLEILEKTARAVHYAHGEGIIHRDLKPGNVLLDSHGEPQVTDFGLAKDIETDFSLTQSGAAMGTPAYMSPEQARGDQESTDARSDIYSLGAMLYEMVTGRPPFTADHQLALLLQVAREDPVPPRRLNASLDRDVETICLKCLSKEPARRYQTAAELADDIRGHLNHQPIAARPSSVWYRTKKRVLRNKALAAVSALAVFAVIALVSGWVVTLQQRTREALAARSKAEKLAEAEAERKQEAQAARDAANAAKKEAEAKAQELARQLDDAYWEAYKKFEGRGDVAGKVLVCAAAQSHLGRSGLSSSKQWGCLTDGALHSLPALAFSTPAGHGWYATCYSPSGAMLAASGGGGSMMVWDLNTGREKATFRSREFVSCLSFSPDERLIASGDGAGDVMLWDLAGAREPVRLEGHTGEVVAVSFAPNGETLVTGDEGGTIRTWDMATHRARSVLRGHWQWPEILRFSPDGSIFAAAFGYAGVIIWDTETGREKERLDIPGTQCIQTSVNRMISRLSNRKWNSFFVA